MARAIAEPKTAGRGDPVTSFEAAWVVRGEANLADFLPAPGHPARPATLLALARLDLELRGGSGRSRPPEDYLREYPELGRGGLAELVAAERRLRLDAGHDAGLAGSRDRPSCESAGWSAPGRGLDRPAASTGRRRIDPASVARSYFDFRLSAEDRGDGLGLGETRDQWAGTAPDAAETVEVLRDGRRAGPDGARRPAEAAVTMPEPGTDFLGFRLLSELGRGAFGRVYLASQGDLADRPVALKVSTEKPAESQTLAQLQHTNIVPIFSAHRAEPFHAVCMPYFGSTTLKDIFDELELRQAPPTSGEDLLKSLGSRHFAEPHGGAAAGPEADDEATPLPRPAARPRSDTLLMLGKLPYVEAGLWLGSRLADGLAHAHGRGILHRDLKPANILLTDDGQPMLLDFNLAADARRPASSGSFGGTLPYMAPEHIRAFRGEDRAVDARSDIYSLGVIIYELLAGRHPFGTYAGSSMAVLARMAEERESAPVGLRAWNPQASPAVESIVRHCLEPDPARRYQTAAELHEDLERHLANLPLRHAAEPSPRERARKWARRHPRLTSSTSMAVAAGLVSLGMLLALFARQDRLAKLEAADALAGFRVEVATVQFLLNTRTADRDRRARGVALGREALARYHVLEDPAWPAGPLARHLDPARRDELKEEVGEVLLYLARAGALDASDHPAGDARRLGRAEAALRLCDLSRACFAADRSPRAMLLHHAELLGLLGRDDQAKLIRAEAESAPLRTARDHHLAATGLINQGEFRRALPLAEEATRLDPRDFRGWFTLGICREQVGRGAEADAAYSTCIALRPESPFAWFNRAETHLARGDHKRALVDFDRAVALDPAWADPLVERAIAEHHEGLFPRAIADLTAALDRGAPRVRTLFLRATTRERAGDADGARRDRAEAMTVDPRDEQGWIMRALSRMAAEPDAALADLDRALALNPRSLSALQNKAYLLSERLGRAEEAIRALDRAVELYPDYVPSRSGRGVLLAILGRRDAALADARESVWRDTGPHILYQVAGIYAMTSKLVPEDRTESYRLLSTALRNGFGFDEMADDRELDPIRQQPEFRRLLDAARAIRSIAPGP